MMGDWVHLHVNSIVKNSEYASLCLDVFSSISQYTIRFVFRIRLQRVSLLSTSTFTPTHERHETAQTT